jgi:hypothetical protein
MATPYGRIARESIEGDLADAIHDVMEEADGSGRADVDDEPATCGHQQRRRVVGGDIRRSATDVDQGVPVRDRRFPERHSGIEMTEHPKRVV